MNYRQVLVEHSIKINEVRRKGYEPNIYQFFKYLKFPAKDPLKSFTSTFCKLHCF